MIRLISAVVNYFSYEDGDAEYEDGGDNRKTNPTDVAPAGVVLSEENQDFIVKNKKHSSETSLGNTDDKKLKKVFDGKVTRFFNGSGLIDEHIHFVSSCIVGGEVPIVGCDVHGEATRIHRDGGWVATKMQIVNTWDNETENDASTDTIITEIVSVRGEDIELGNNLKARRSACKLGYRPFRGDFVQVHVSFAEDDQIKFVHSISPAREKTFNGTVTEVLNSHGFVNHDVFFPFNACTKGYFAKEGDFVKVLAVEAKQIRGDWRGLCVMPLNTNRSKADNKKEYSLKLEKLKVLLSNKNDVTISNECDFGTVPLGETKAILFFIRNKGEAPRRFHSATFTTIDSQFFLLMGPDLKAHPDKVLQCTNSKSSGEICCGLLEDESNINPNEVKVIVIEFISKCLGKCDQLVTFSFDGFTIGRALTVVVSDAMEEAIDRKSEYRQGKKKTSDFGTYGDTFLVAGEKPTRRRKTFIPNHLKQYQIPTNIRDCLKNGEDPESIFPWINMPLTWNSYRPKLAGLLYMEEIQAEEEMKEFDLHKVTLRPFNEFLMIQVPGLAEGRPSLLTGDRLVLQFTDDAFGPQYEGYIHEIRAEEILVKFNVAFHQKYRNDDCDIHFFCNRTTRRRCHQALEIAKNVGEQVLFPNRIVPKLPLVNALDIEGMVFFNKKLNKRQKAAVRRITAGQGRPLPYIVFGPPGTGKTVTLVESILQVFSNITYSRILAAAPSNSAADLIALRLHESGIVKKKELVRLNAFQRSSEVPEEIQQYCIKESDDLSFATRRRLIVATCSTSGQLCSLALKVGYFSHVFIDEAGQATEPECLIPMGMVAQNPEAQIVLAGDPRQLGPVVRSNLANLYGLSVSLLERLMDRQLYHRDMSNFAKYGGYNPFLLTKLIFNYRSHVYLLEIPSALFYDTELIPSAPKHITDLFLGSDILINRDCPFIFHGIRGEDLREGDSPSWFNSAEAVQVMRYVQSLVGKFYCIQPADIGVITPYRKQVEKIRLLLDRVELNDIKVGSVEEFQGQERRIIIISTVRSNENVIQSDIYHNMGFLRNPKRFNVSITRAEALLVVVGNPYVLCQDPYWCCLIQLAVLSRAYIGCDLPSLDDPKRNENFRIALELLGLADETVELDDQKYNVSLDMRNKEQSFRLQSNEPVVQNVKSYVKQTRLPKVSPELDSQRENARTSSCVNAKNRRSFQSGTSEPVKSPVYSDLEDHSSDLITGANLPLYSDSAIKEDTTTLPPHTNRFKTKTPKFRSKAYTRFLESLSNREKSSYDEDKPS